MLWDLLDPLHLAHFPKGGATGRQHWKFTTKVCARGADILNTQAAQLKQDWLELTRGLIGDTGMEVM